MVLATECTLAVEPLFGTAKGVRGNLPPLRHARTLFLPMLTALGARVCRVEAPPAKEPEAGAGRGGAASWVQHEQCACPGVPFTLWAVCGQESRAQMQWVLVISYLWSVWGSRLRGFQCKNLAVGQHHTAPEPRTTRFSLSLSLSRTVACRGDIPRSHTSTCAPVRPRADGKGK